MIDWFYGISTLDDTKEKIVKLRSPIIYNWKIYLLNHLKPVKTLYLVAIWIFWEPTYQCSSESFKTSSQIDLFDPKMGP